MIKKLLLTSLLVAGSVLLFAQTPMFFNTNSAGGGNVFPFGNLAASRKVQWFIPPNSLGAVAPGNNITKVWFQAGSTASQTYPIFTIKLKNGSGTGLTGVASGPIEPGMTVVYSAVNQTLSTTTGVWFGFNLQTPWLYNPNQPLIVEVEHNATSGSGPSIYQFTSIPGPGNGRQWADYNVGTLTGIGTNQVNFGIDVIPATPCTVAPIANTIVPSSFSTCPFISNPTMSLASTYSFGGITYQWQSSTISPVGPWSAIPNATMSQAPSGTIGVTTWFTCVATCTNPGGGSTTITPTQFYVSGSVTSTPPYYENFEGLQANNRLPNCSWTAPNLGSSITTWLTSQTGNRIANSGTMFGNFVAPSTNNFVYTNGITLQPGITYSAAIWYSTEYTGANNWTNLSLMVGPNQSPTGMQLIAQVSPAVSGPYKLLSGVFTVPSAGDYYIGIRANGGSGGAPYLNFDDLSVTIPCSGAGAVNSPTVLIPSNSTTICAGDPLTINAAGADAYLWNDGTIGNLWTGTPQSNTVISVAGTNTLTGCVNVASMNVQVDARPNLFVFGTPPSICPGQTSFLTASGAVTYAWNTGSNLQSISVTPATNTTYTVNGTGNNGCVATGTVAVSVKPQPTITIAPNPEACAGEMVTISAFGASTYAWYSSSSPVVLQGSNVIVQLFNSTTFTVIGTGANGCTGQQTTSQSMALCQGIAENSNSKQLSVYPNPSDGHFHLELSSGSIVKVIVTDVSGKEVLHINGTSNTADLNLTALASGVYYAAIMEADASHMIRLIKQ